MKELKNCPLCGSHGELTSIPFALTQKYFVKCSSCLLRSAAIEVNDKKTPTQAIDEAVGLWNSRTEDTRRVKVRRINRVKAQ